MFLEKVTQTKLKNVFVVDYFLQGINITIGECLQQQGCESVLCDMSPGAMIRLTDVF